MHVWDLENGGWIYSKPAQALSMLEFSPARDILAVADQDAIRLLEPVDGRELARIKDTGGRVRSLVFSPNGRYLAAASSASVRIWDVESGSLLTRLWGHSGQVVRIAFRSDGKYLAAAVDDAYMAFVWDVEEALKARELMADRAAGWVDTGGPARQVAFYGDWLVATSLTGGVNAWAMSDVIKKRAKPVKLATGYFGPLSTGGSIAAGSTNGRVHLFAIEGIAAKELYVLNAARKSSDLIDLTATQVVLGGVVTRGGVTHLQWAGLKLLTTSDDGGVKLWQEQARTINPGPRGLGVVITAAWAPKAHSRRRCRPQPRRYG